MGVEQEIEELKRRVSELENIYQQKRREKKGFSLVEKLLILIFVIIAVYIVLALVGYISFVSEFL